MRRAPLLDHGQVKPISIHAPQWGATGESRPRRRKPSYFNPRTPVGCDVAEQGHVGAVQRISIHAPQWGATLWLSVAIICSGNFNPRTPVGCDHREGRRPPSPAHFNPRTPVGCDVALRRVAIVGIFQSTHPSGVRRACNPACPANNPFQSTHPSGVRLSRNALPFNARAISIHAPQWGATRRTLSLSCPE